MPDTDDDFYVIAEDDDDLPEVAVNWFRTLLKLEMAIWALGVMVALLGIGYLLVSG